LCRKTLQLTQPELGRTNFFGSMDQRVTPFSHQSFGDGHRSCSANRQVATFNHANSTMRLCVRFIFLLGVVSAPALTSRALPITPPALTSSLAAPDRDIVRNPYSGFAGSLNRAPVSVVPSASVPAFAPASAIFGSGGGGAFSVPSFAPFPASIGSGFVPPPASYLYTAPAQTGGVYFSLSNAPRQSNVTIGSVQVPEGGPTVVLLGLSLVGLALLGRSRAFTAFRKR